MKKPSWALTSVSAVAILAIIAAGASYSDLRLWRAKYTEAKRSIDKHVRNCIRLFKIRAAVKGLADPIVVLGDSTTEIAPLPQAIDGHSVVNAGIGGATIRDFMVFAPQILDGVRPALSVVALGMNDSGSTSVAADYTALLVMLKRLSPHVLCIEVTSAVGSDLTNSEIRKAANALGVRIVDTGMPPSETIDGVHPTHAGFDVWDAAVVRAIRDVIDATP